MQVIKAVGRDASVIKYDILTALLVMAAQDSGRNGRLSLRLSLLITARFNWRNRTFQVGQTEIARLWGITERSTKRELAQMRAQGWISVTRPAARGRVATHTIHLERILSDSAPRWPSVGPDFTDRLSGPISAPADNVVPIFPKHPAPLPDGVPWATISGLLRDRDPVVFEAWFARLQQDAVIDGVLHLAAPTQFVANYVSTHFSVVLLGAARQVDPDLRAVHVLWAG